MASDEARDLIVAHADPGFLGGALPEACRDQPVDGDPAEIQGLFYFLIELVFHLGLRRAPKRLVGILVFLPRDPRAADVGDSLAVLVRPIEPPPAHRDDEDDRDGHHEETQAPGVVDGQRADGLQHDVRLRKAGVVFSLAKPAVGGGRLGGGSG